MTIQMTIASGDDWSGVYIDDNLVDEGHSINPFDSASLAVEYRVECVVQRGVDAVWLEDIGNLPDSICDVQWDEPFAAATQVGVA